MRKNWYKLTEDEKAEFKEKLLLTWIVELRYIMDDDFHIMYFYDLLQDKKREYKELELYEMLDVIKEIEKDFTK